MLANSSFRCRPTSQNIPTLPPWKGYDSFATVGPRLAEGHFRVDFLQLATPLLYFVSFGVVFALFASVTTAIIWILIRVFRVVVRWLRWALQE
jgi:hypothetical protein